MILKQILFLSLVLGATSVWAQEKSTYRIASSGGIENLEVYHAALESKDLDIYRLVDQPRIIKFDSGVEVELFSALYLEEEYGRMRDHRYMQRMGDETIYPWYWSMDTHGTIVDKRIHAIAE